MKRIGVVKKKITEREIELKILILKAGLRLKDIAEPTGYSIHMVCKYIKGIRRSKRLDEYFEKLRGNKNANLSGS